MKAARGWLLDLGGNQVPFAEAWALQKYLVAARQHGEIPDVLVLLEHPPVVTLGRSGKAEHLRATREEMLSAGIELFRIERGGSATYHGPGQLVGYPIVDLRLVNEDIVRYVRALEATIIDTLGAFGIAAGREPGLPGVWVAGAKICALGVAVQRRVTMHGFALNVTTGLGGFSLINACGLDRPVTSMSAVLGRPVDIAGVRRVYSEQFSRAFGIDLVQVTAADLEQARALV
ncbi:MAG: lipoyl(octanoyl) transferase LipB [Armatimonadetes bacterium]|nr:lipoyl(octanoyl) transferase LipB [Armatimonadota bacterium]